MTNSVDPDEMAHYEPSHLDLQCLHRYWFWFAELKGPNRALHFEVTGKDEKFS